MKTLYLVRHAKSSWDYDLDDFDRPLNKRGEFDAPMMGRIMFENGHRPDYILSSPASRAIKTATHFANELKFPNHIATSHDLYHASAANLLQIIKKTRNDIQKLMLFGHNPGLTSFANQMTTELVDNIPTCGIYAITFDVQNWDGIAMKRGKLLLYDYPKNHKK